MAGLSEERRCFFSWLRFSVAIVAPLLSLLLVAAAAVDTVNAQSDSINNHPFQEGYYEKQQQQQQQYHPRFRPSLNYDTSYMGGGASMYGASPPSYGHPPPLPASQYGQQQQQQWQKRRRLQQQNDSTGNGGADDNSNSSFQNGPDPSYEAQLRLTLLQNYDRNSYPWEVLWAAHQESGNDRTGLEVEFNLNFHKVHRLNVAESTAHLVVWVQMRWNDPRLAWDPEEFGNITKTWFWIENGMAGGEVSEIWTPDMYLWNQEESMDRTMADTYAAVDPDGTVYWSRPGVLKSTCKFRGLGAFPFDHLRCTLEFGSWTRSGLYIRPTKMGGVGYSVGGSETAGQSFAEFELKAVTSSEFVYPPFPIAPEEDWPVILYNIECQRASRPYVRGYLLLQIMLNFCAFACMWIPPHVGERMGLAITALLASVASELTISEQLPNSQEANWFIIFSLTSMIFSVAIVFQSTAVIYFWYFTGSSLTPTYIKWILSKQASKNKSQVAKDGADTGNDTVLPQNGDLSSAEVSDMDMTARVGNNATTHSHAKVNTPRQSTVQLDRPASTEEDEQSLQFLAAKEAFNASISSHFHLRHDAEDFRDDQERKNNLQWQKIAKTIDNYSRLIIPAAYVVFLAVIMSTTGEFPTYSIPDISGQSYTPGSVDFD